jgi:lysophospholipase L1-like esterase
MAGAAGASGTAGSAGSGSSTRPSSWRIAFLGDSITETSCTSQLVFDALEKEGHTNIDLVGTKQNQQGCGIDEPDRDCEGHSGYLVTELVGSGPKASELPMWCAADRADLVLMHFGTNDAWNSGISIMDIIRAYSGVVAALRAVQPHVIVLVAQIIPLSPDNCTDCEARVRALNEEIPAWAASESSPDSPIYVVDQWTGFDSSSDAYDRVHPNMQGSQKMASVWLDALRAQKIF